jgi:hypothetical protein
MGTGAESSAASVASEEASSGVASLIEMVSEETSTDAR